jgi:signal transduction histidine kinase/ActR/RegA family two-component response regulator
LIASQRIDLVRRSYNQWVADQTLEDYALRFTAKSARRWSAARVANTALGAISFLALEAIGAAITLNYGVANAVPAILAVSVIIFACGLPVAYFAAKGGVDIDLLTRGAGFGYIGSTITSLIYASFTFIFFAIEAVILATALDLCFGIPKPIGYLLGALAVIPLVTYGVTLISRFQLWTQPFWIALHVLPFAAIALTDGQAFEGWTHFNGLHAGLDGRFHLRLFGAAASVVFALVAQIGEQVDFLRFLPPPRGKTDFRWWAALIAAGPGWIGPGALKLLAGSFLAYFALRHGEAAANAGDPAHMYLNAFNAVSGRPRVALVLTGLFVLLSQIKINVTNAYAGSIAWSNFFSRLTHAHPGRVVWLVFNVMVAVLLMEIGVYETLERTLALYSNVAVAWVGTLVADLVIVRPLGLRPPTMEFQRAYLYDVNPVGVGAMLAATLASILSFYGLFGSWVAPLAPFVSLVVALVAAPALAWATGGKYYIARQREPNWNAHGEIKCTVCEHEFEAEDMGSCPAYAGPICSLCCSLDARCGDLCKPHARLSAQISAAIGEVLPTTALDRLNSQLGRYLVTLSVTTGLFGLALYLIYLQVQSGHVGNDGELAAALWRVFFASFIILSIVTWLVVLAQESRRAAEEESKRQTTLLMKEIEAHGRTDAALQKAKEAAEAANLAKSRYVVGLSHELRSPLNAIGGYAQLLEQDRALHDRAREQIRVVRRSAQHLSSLIDGILDISKIEAGRLHLSRDEVRLVDFLDQLVAMLRIQAAEKGLEFVFRRPERLPLLVYADEKRLRQVLINLLSNAIKFTRKGEVGLSIAHRSPVFEFEVFDTGPGIAADEIERIFEPFQRGSLGVAQPHTGTGLGLTICKLLTGVMGGNIVVKSTPGVGSRFKVTLLLSEVREPLLISPLAAPIFGYEGPRKTILVTDDDPIQSDLLRATLEPLGFIILTAEDSRSCLMMAGHCEPDMFLLDVSMPGEDGWTLARRLREGGRRDAHIVMVSASALEAHSSPLAETLHDGYLMKPFDIPRLLELIGHLLKIKWRHDGQVVDTPVWNPQPYELPEDDVLDALRQRGELGHLKGVRELLDAIGADDPRFAPFVAKMRLLIDRCDFDQFLASVRTPSRHET